MAADVTPGSIRELGDAELAGWDARTVAVPGGDVYQSVAWGRYRGRHGWRPRFLAFDDGFLLLALERPWPIVRGSGVYISRGPVTAGEPAERTADRLVAAARFLVHGGVGVVATDAQVPAGVGYAERLAAHGFHGIEELQPSRHRMALPLAPEASEDEVLMSFGTTTRRWIRGAQKKGVRVVRYDSVEGDASEGLERPATPLEEALPAALGRLYELLVATATRRSFRLGERGPFLDWGVSGVRAGHVVVLESLTPDGETGAAAMFYRHGGRLTYSHSGDRTELRRSFPGIAHLQMWRAIQLAHREGIGEFDLGGVDVPGARRAPAEGEPMWGLYAFKRSFGAEWVEQVGALEWVARPWRYRAGRVVGRVAALARRR